MITQLFLDLYHDGERIASSGTPIRLIDMEPGGCQIEFPDGKTEIVMPEIISSGIHSPEETLSELSKMSGVREDTLLKAAQNNRLMARKSGATWLSTLNAVEWAIADGKIRKRIDRNKIASE